MHHPNRSSMELHGQQALHWMIEHFSSLPRQSIGAFASRAAMDSALWETPTESGEDFGDVLARFSRLVAPHAMRVSHPRFLAFVPGAPNYYSVLGEALCAAANFFSGVWLEAAGPTEVELVVLDWFRQWLGLPESTRGILTSGGSEANLTALVTARERLSYPDRSRAVLYVSEARHLSMDRAAHIAGLHRDQVRIVPTDSLYRLDVRALATGVADDRRKDLLPWMLTANAGTTNTGSVDPLAALAAYCQQERIWLHVDGAYGWSAVLTDEGRRALAGIEHADSVTLDPHKWLAQTFDAGCILVRDGELLRSTFALRPDYMQDVAPASDEVNFADYGIALTRRFRALKIWLSVKVLGLGWYRDLVRHCCGLADYAQRMLEQSSLFEVLCPRQLSIVCFRFRPAGEEWTDARLDRLNLDLVDVVRATGKAFLSSTRLANRVALRFCFVNWRTTAGDVDFIVQLLAEMGGKLCKCDDVPPAP